MRAISAICARISLAPSAQLSPIENGAAWRIEFQNAAGVWPGQQAAGAVGDGAGDHDRQPHAARFADVGDGGDRRLGVERVEDRLDQQEVGAALDQAVDLLGIGGAQLVEGDGAEARIGHVGRDRGGAVGRPERAGDEARPAVLALRDVGRVARQPRALDVELVREVGHAVVGLRDAGRGERVGRDDVGAGAEIGEMDVAHRVRLAEDQQIVVAAHLAVPGVEARAAIALLVELSAWIMVPIAPSSTRMRSRTSWCRFRWRSCSLGSLPTPREMRSSQRASAAFHCARDGSHPHSLARNPPPPRESEWARDALPGIRSATGRADGRRRRRGRRGSWCRSGNR